MILFNEVGEMGVWRAVDAKCFAASFNRESGISDGARLVLDGSHLPSSPS